MKTIKSDVVIIGAGPVGLFSIFECGMMGLKTHVIDSLSSIGGQCTTLYPEKPIYDIPVWPKISGNNLIKNLEKQAEPFNPVFHLEQNVKTLYREENLWCLETSNNILFKTKAVIIAAGVGAFSPKRLPLENTEDYEENSIFYAIRKKSQFINKNITIIGGGDSALDWTIALVNIAKTITLVHRRDKFRAIPKKIEIIKELHARKKLDIVTPYQLKELKGDKTNLSSIIIENFKGHTREINTDILLPFYGLSTNLQHMKQWGIKFINEHIVVTPSDCQTNLEGIFAIGDIAYYKGKKKLILTGFSESTQAAYSIRSIIYPNKNFRFEHSTTKGVPSNKY